METEPRYTGHVSFNDDDDDDEEELITEQELYGGSYPRLMALYTLTPLTWIVTFTLFALLPPTLYPTTQRPTYPYAPYLPYPLPEFLLSLATWSLTYLLQEPTYALLTLLTAALPALPPSVPTLLSTALHTLLALLARQAAIPLLLVPQSQRSPAPNAWDPAFRRVWWVALGWSAAEAVVGIKQGYDAIALYRDVLPPRVEPRAPRSREGFRRAGDYGSGAQRAGPSNGGVSFEPGRSPMDLLDRGAEDDVYGEPGFYDQAGQEGEEDPLLPRRRSSSTRLEFELEDALKVQVDHDIEQLVTLKNREELEEIYGMPVIRIPVFLSCLQRIDSLLLSLGSCLLLTSAYLRSTLALAPSDSPVGPAKTNRPLLITFPLVFLVQFALAVLHTPLVLPRVGVHTVVYTGLIVSLGTFFAGLGVWRGFRDGGGAMDLLVVWRVV